MPEDTNAPVLEPTVSDNDYFDRAAADFEAKNNAETTKPTETTAAVTEKPVEQPPKETAPEIPDEVLTGQKTGKPKEDEDDIPTPEFRKPETRKHWDDLKGRYTVAKTKLQTAEARLAELEKKAGQAADSSKYDEQIKAAENRIKELETTIERTAFQESPRYKGLLAKENGSIEAAKGYLDGMDIPKRVIDIAASQSGADRLKTLKEAGADAETIAAVMPYLAHADTIRAEREAALAGYKEEHAREMAAEAQRREAETAQQKEKDATIFKGALDFAAKEFFPFRKVEGHDAWNAEVEKTIERARAIFEGGDLPDADVAMVAIRAAGYEVQQGIIGRLQNRLKELQTENATLKAAQPDIHGKNKDGRQNQTNDPNSPYSFESAGERFEADYRSRSA